MNINNIGQKIVILIEKLLLIRDEDVPIHNINEYDFLYKMQHNYLEIKNEIQQYDNTLLKNFEDLSVEQKQIVEAKKWKVLFLKVYGKEIEQNCISFPNTSKLITHNSIKTVMFSSLEPNTFISKHRGPYKGVLRFLLGLQIPKENQCCVLKINNESIFWEEGKAILFDDTFEHETWNASNEKRLILFVDVERKLKFPFNLLNKLIIRTIGLSPFIRTIYKNS